MGRRVAISATFSSAILVTAAGLAQPEPEPSTAEAPPEAAPPDGAPPDGAPPDAAPPDAAPPDAAPDAAPPDGAPLREPQPVTEPAEADDAAAVVEHDPPLGVGEKRPLPDYDGRGDDPLTAGDVLIWIPRGLFYPLYLVTEYLIRWPLGKATVFVEENDVPEVVANFFTFGPNANYGIVPSFLIDFGLRPSIGLYFFGDDVGGVEGLGLRSHLAFGGVNWYRATGSIRYDVSEETVDTRASFVQLKGIYSHRPDWLYWGQGPRSRDEHESSFTIQQIEGVASYLGGFWRSSYIAADLGVRDVVFKTDSCCAPIALATAVDRGLFAKPEIFDDGYLLGYFGIDASLDTREERFNYEGEASDHVSPSGSGFKLAGRFDFGGGLRESELPGGRSERPLFARYGGTAGAFLDLYAHRVVGLQAIVDFVDPLADGIIPFTELIDLGGNRPLRGFLPRRLVDRSAAAAVLDYRWPIWVWLDGSLFYALGNVFGEHLEGFDPALFRQSFGMGFRANAAEDHTFELLVAGGTDTFEEGGEVESFRLVFGSTAGF